ncbi:MAG: 3-deoxy-D-manno-octulosonic acid transferase [Betaproteobacteria bacterium HGW-Betaproteobacteria-11]|nr:MAG: 3-deoxy-D-manno-octulosonic acid transferase [Betaproteobacteria bacterium HGW-Betaproteobacteria-11]
MIARLLYTLLALVMLPWALLHLLLRSRRQPEYLEHVGERFGCFPATPGSPDAPVIWLHAVSVGETRAAEPLVAALHEQFPDHRLLFTHMTPTGRAASLALFADTVERIYLPYDLPWAMRRFLRHYRPRLGLILETELWPNLLAACHAEGIPVLLVNARLSARSAARYGSFPALTWDALHHLTAIGAQSVADAGRFAALGAEAVTVTGNMKFDCAPPPAQHALAEVFRARIGARPCWLAASTREGEEALILEAWQKVHGGDPKVVQSKYNAGADDTAANPLLILVPRHPQRFDEVVRLIEAHGLKLQRRSDELPVAADTRVWLGDSMGEMFAWYGAADLAFIGGSLKDYGSQNLIEACAMGTPVLIGRSTFNFAGAAGAALECGAARAVADADDLVRQVLALLPDATARQRMGQAGRTFTSVHAGATARTLELITRAGR